MHRREAMLSVSAFDVKGGAVKIAVCIRRVPDTSEAEVRVDDTGKDIVKDKLAFTVNEADNYALEEALRLKEKVNGQVTLVSVGPKEAEEVLRIGLAKGADGAVRIDDTGLAGTSASSLARVLSDFLKPGGFDLVFTGCIAQDAEDSQVGPMVAQMLGWPHAAYVIALEPKGERLHVKRELEGGFLEVKELERPAVVTIQTGGNSPRYASVMGIKRAKLKPLEGTNPAALGRSPDDLGARARLMRLYAPPVVSAAEMIPGDTAEKAGRVAEILKAKGIA